MWRTVKLLSCLFFTTFLFGAQQTIVPNILYSQKSPFGLIEIAPSATPGFLAVYEGKDYSVCHSMFMQGDPTYLCLDYVRLITTNFCFVRNLQKTLLLGLGAGNFLGYLISYFPDTQVDAVEINPVMIDIVKSFRGFGLNNNINYFCEDGFKYIDKINKKYDLIFCDMYFAKPAVSKNYKNLFKKLKAHLSEEGVFVFNAYIPFMPRIVVENMFEIFNNIAAAVTNEGFNIIFIGYQGPVKTKQELQNIATQMQAQYNFRYALPDLVKKIVLIPLDQKSAWIEKFPILD